MSNRPKLKWLTLIPIAIIFVFLFKPGLRLIFPIPYKAVVYQVAEKYKIDPNLIVAIMQVESSFNPVAVSPKGAVGLMQLMPDTARWVAEQMRIEQFDHSSLTNPELNIEMGTWYLTYLQGLFNQDMVVVIAAYNGGLGNAKKWLEEDIWNGDLNSLSSIPFKETREYVQKVIDTYQFYRALYPNSNERYF
jgi:soluble lytic murein transglycosylase